MTSIAFARFQIEHETVLADIELAEGGAAEIAHRRTGPHRLAFRCLDLDDLRPHVGQHPRAMRAGNGGRKIQHAETLKTLGRNYQRHFAVLSFRTP